MNLESEDENREGQDRWLVSYADFITLMFAFFIVLYATSERNKEKTEKFQESIKRYLIKAGVAGGTGEKLEQNEKFNTVIEAPIATFQKTKTPPEEDLNLVETELEKIFSPEELKKYILDISNDDFGVRIVLINPSLFAQGSTQFNSEALGFLNKMGAFLAKVNKKILVEGHSQAHNTAYSNEWEFASARAVTFVRYLSKVHKVDSSKLIVMSYGSQRPYEPSNAKQAAIMNERLEVVIMNGDVGL